MDPIEVLVLDHYLIRLYDEMDHNKDANQESFGYDQMYTIGDEDASISLLGIRLSSDDDIEYNCLIGSAYEFYGVDYNSYLLNDSEIIICFTNSIIKLSIPELRMDWMVQADEVACFGIYEIDEGFIIHGKNKISRLDLQGKLMWQQYSKDSWISEEGVSMIEVNGRCILVSDGQDYTSKFDFDGQLLERYRKNAL